jgi:2'-5' RNA ligase
MIEKWRCFMAVTPGQELNRRFRELIRGLDGDCRQAGQQVRWVHPSKLHLTLRFLGDIPVPLVWALQDAMRDLDAISRFDLSFEGIGAFPDPAKPKVVWAGVSDPGGGLASLHEKVSSILEQQGVPRESREFSPHLTLGRIRRPEADITDVVQGHIEEQFGRMQVSEVVFYRSILDRSGAIHEPKWSARLGKERKPRH